MPYPLRSRRLPSVRATLAFGLRAACIAAIPIGAALASERPAPIQLAELTADAARWDAGAGFRASDRLPDSTTPRVGARVGTKTTATLGLVPRSSALELRADYRFATHWGIGGRYLGRPPLAAQADGQPRLGAGRDDAIALGITKSETWFSGDRWSLTVSQPMRFGGGPLATDSFAEVPDYGGLGFKSGAREVRTELEYFTPISKSMGLGLSLINRMRPNSDAQAPDDRIMMMRFSTRF